MLVTCHKHLYFPSSKVHRQIPNTASTRCRETWNILIFPRAKHTDHISRRIWAEHSKIERFLGAATYWPIQSLYSTLSLCDHVLFMLPLRCYLIQSIHKLFHPGLWKITYSCFLRHSHNDESILGFSFRVLLGDRGHSSPRRRRPCCLQSKAYDGGPKSQAVTK